jgi:VWFA-related protein
MFRHVIFASILLSVTVWFGAHAPVVGRSAPLGTPEQVVPSDLVPVTVHVLDKAGRPVSDLEASDFTIAEDGLPQVLQSFAPIALTAAAAQPGAALAVRTGFAAAEDRRVILIALGLGRLEEPTETISALITFVKTGLLPQDVVGLFAYDRAVSFTNDHQKILAALERLEKTHEDLDYELGQQLGPTGMAGLYGSRVLSKKLQGKIDAAVVGPDAKPATPLSADVIEPSQFAGLPLDDFMASAATTLQDQGNLMALIEYIQHFDGEKHVLFVTEKGFLWPADDNDRALAEAANEARAAIHVLQAGGLLRPADDSSSRAFDATMQQATSLRSLRQIAELSGGYASIMEKGPVAVARLDALSRSGYRLGFRSLRTGWDGALRKLAVRVNRPDLTVIYPHGYVRTQAVPGFDRRGFISNDRLSAAGNFRREVGDIKVKAAATQRGGTSLEIQGRIDLAKVKVGSAGGSRVGLLDVAAYCFNASSDGRAVTTTGLHTQRLAIKLTEEDYARHLKDGYPYSISFPIIKGTNHVRFVVYDFGSDLIGRTDVPVH